MTTNVTQIEDLRYYEALLQNAGLQSGNCTVTPFVASFNGLYPSGTTGYLDLSNITAGVTPTYGRNLYFGSFFASSFCEVWTVNALVRFGLEIPAVPATVSEWQFDVKNITAAEACDYTKRVLVNSVCFFAPKFSITGGNIQYRISGTFNGVRISY